MGCFLWRWSAEMSSPSFSPSRETAFKNEGLASLNMRSLSVGPYAAVGARSYRLAPLQFHSLVPPRCSKGGCITLINIIKVINEPNCFVVSSEKPEELRPCACGGLGRRREFTSVLKEHTRRLLPDVVEGNLVPTGEASLLIALWLEIIGQCLQFWEKAALPFCFFN